MAVECIPGCGNCCPAFECRHFTSDRKCAAYGDITKDGYMEMSCEYWVKNGVFCKAYYGDEVPEGKKVVIAPRGQVILVDA